MSMISKQIEELRFYTKDRKGELAKLINDAADTIEMLSAKLQASQMERSSQYYHGGWIPCSERSPDEYGEYLVTKHTIQSDGTAKNTASNDIAYFDNDGFHKADMVIAGMPLPEPYTEKMNGDKQDEDTESS